MGQLDAGLLLKQFAGEMRNRPDARRGEGEPAGRASRQGHQLADAARAASLFADTNTNGELPIIPTGVKSVTGSNGSFGVTAAMVACELVLAISIV